MNTKLTSSKNYYIFAYDSPQGPATGTYSAMAYTVEEAKKTITSELTNVFGPFDFNLKLTVSVTSF